MSALVKTEENAVGGGTMTSQNGVHGWKNIALGGRRGTVSGVLKMNKDGIAWRSKGGQSVTMVGADLSSATWTRLNARLYTLRLSVKGGTVYRFDGFSSQDGEFLKRFLLESFGVALEDERTSTRGWNWGSAEVRDGQLLFFVGTGFSVNSVRCRHLEIYQCSRAVHFRMEVMTLMNYFLGEERAWEVPLREVHEGKIIGKGHEIAVELHQDDTLAQDIDALVELKLYLGKGGEGNDGLKVAQDAAQTLLEEITSQAAPVASSNAALITFEDIPVLVPRGRFEIELGATSMRLHGKAVHDYKIQYSSIVRLFQLPKPDQAAMLFILSLEPPIRQGHQTYPHIVMQLPENEDTQLNVELPPGAESDERLQQLAAIESGPTFQVMARVFKVLTDKRITVPKSFKSKEGARAVKCSFKANDGYLYPLERSLFFVHKPPTYIRFEEILSTELLRVSGDSTNRTFDLAVNLRGQQGQMQFKGIAREEYNALFQFLQEKQLRIVNLDTLQAQSGQAHLVDDASDSEDADFNEQQVASEEEDEEEEEGEAEGDAEEEESKGTKRPRETRVTRSRRGDPNEKLEALELNDDYDEASSLGDGSGSDSGDEEEEEEAEEPPKKKLKSEPKEEKPAPKALDDDDAADFDD